MAILEQLDPNDPLHVAVNSCLSTTFYTAACLSEFTLHNLTCFDPQLHVSPAAIFEDIDHNGLKSTGFHLPKTKTGGPEDMSWSAQHGWTDLKAALERHLTFNKPPPSGPLFAYCYRGKHRPLTKSKVIKGGPMGSLDPRQEHGICIGSTLEYLLRRVPFDVMKVKGHWASDAFTLYLRKHAQILAPYMQATPCLPYAKGKPLLLS